MFHTALFALHQPRWHLLLTGKKQLSHGWSSGGLYSASELIAEVDLVWFTQLLLNILLYKAGLPDFLSQQLMLLLPH